MVRVTIRMLLPLQKYGEALKILKFVAGQSRILEGCISSLIYGDLEEMNVILIEEMWRDQESLDKHLRSEEYHTLLQVMEMALECPELRFDTIANSTGIETVEKARGLVKKSLGKK